MNTGILKNILELARVSNLPTVWTNVLAAVVLSGPEFRWADFLLLALSMSFFYAAGMCLNDICDADSDRARKPFRPIPSGRISIKNAYVLTAILFSAAILLLLFAPYQKAVYAGFLLLIIIIAYDYFHKAHAPGVLLMALCRLLVYSTTSIAVIGTVSLPAAIGGSIQFVYILALSLLARHEYRMNNNFTYPVISIMIASIALLDGIIMAVLVSPAWILAGIGGAILTYFSQKYFRGD